MQSALAHRHCKSGLRGEMKIKPIGGDQVNYHLFCGVSDEDVHTQGMEGYVGIFPTWEDAYKAIGVPDDKWAQIVGHDSIDGAFYEIAHLIDRTRYEGENQRVVTFGWLIEENGAFLEMERRYQKQVTPVPLIALHVTVPNDATYGEFVVNGKFSGQSIIGVTGFVPVTQWIESDPF